MADISKLLMGPGDPAGDEGSDDGSGGDSSELDAAKDLIAAVKRGDAKAASLALKRHYEACKASEEEPDGDESEEY